MLWWGMAYVRYLFSTKTNTTKCASAVIMNLVLLTCTFDHYIPAFPLFVWSHADWITQISGSWGKNNHTNLADCMTSRTCCSRLSSCVLLRWPSTAAKILFYVTHRNGSLLSILLSKPQSCLHQQGFQLLYWPCLLPQTATVPLLYHILTAKTQLLDDMKLCDILLLHAAVVP